MGKSFTNGNWSRIGNNNLGFGLHRYTSGSGMTEKVLWRMEVTGNSNRKLIEIDATILDIREIARWCERAIETLQTDGDRSAEEMPATAEAAE